MVYKAMWTANDNTMPMRILTSTNKNKLISLVRSIANENRNKGATCKWWVWDSDNIMVAAGYTNRLGNQKRLNGPHLAQKAYDEGFFCNY